MLIDGLDGLTTVTDESRRQRWEARADCPLTSTAVLFLVAYAAPILKTDLVDPLPAICSLVTWVAWALFVVDYAARLAPSHDRAIADEVAVSVGEMARVWAASRRALRCSRAGFEYSTTCPAQTSDASPSAASSLRFGWKLRREGRLDIPSDFLAARLGQGLAGA